MNLPTGSITVTLTRDAGVRIGSTNVIMRDGTTTHLFFAPPR